MEFTGERYVSSLKSAQISYEHWHRYLFASSFVDGKSVLDIASGEGYGSSFLAHKAQHVIGVDISSETVSWAKKAYPLENLTFIEGSCSNIPVPGQRVFDVIVSFETIEHIGADEQVLFLNEIKRLLKPDGILIISTPNKLLYSDKNNYKNDFHIKEFYSDEFKKFLFQYFRYVAIGGQKIYTSSWIWSLENLKLPFIDYNIDFVENQFTPVNKQKEDLYNIAICSNLQSVEIPYSGLTDLSQQIQKEYLENLGNIIAEKNLKLQEYHNIIFEKENLISEKNLKLQESGIAIREHEKIIQEKTIQIHYKEQLIYSLYHSFSWKITKPLRLLHSQLTAFFYILFRPDRIMGLGSSEINSWLLKEKVNKTSNGINPLEGNLKGSHDETINSDEIDERQICMIHYVPFVENNTLKNVPVKVLAFYLPQFHSISENDTWWGEGFTEWTNVKPAQPQFKGHYQPRIPGELGYYNLLDVKTQHRQVELAKNYGIGGFCFYFYWFHGKQLLEKPIENYLLNPELDLPFCLSWANENWTRRWDGRVNNILIKQQHTPEDDLAFIMHVSKYMNDKRYIRIDDKPLLIVYRPGLLPSARATTERWRKWCRENGIGEIYLAYTQSFEIEDPVVYGFDAAIQFPPNNFYSKVISQSVKPLNKEFKCNVYDWNKMVTLCEQRTEPGYKLFRCVCPSWDNTPRRKNESTVFINSEPSNFQKWVNNAAMDTCNLFENHDERLIFVNAWNEWAEGAYLEPDAKYGYAFLQNIYDVLHKLEK